MTFNYKYNRCLPLFVVALAVFASCRKQVELGPPVTLVTASNVFRNDNFAIGAQLSLYSQMQAQNYPYYLHRNTGLSSDELTTYSTNQNDKNLYLNSLIATTDAQDASINTWSPTYNYIYQANSIIEGLQTYSGVSEKVKNQLSGESYFLRGLYYFNLVNLYGDVPLITSTDYKVNSVMPRTAKDAVYRQIVNDIKKAASLLSSTYVDAANGPTTERVRPTTWAAAALLARTYLYMGKPDSAEIQANIVIGNTSQFSLLTDLNKVFLKNSSEAIWQLALPGASFYTNDGYIFILTASPVNASLNNLALNAQLLSVFEANDQRKANWVKAFTSGTSTWYYAFKYKDNNKATSVNEYTMMLRLAEQYLIRSEARLQQGNTAGCLADLNVIRRRAGLADYSGQTDQASLLNAIAHERQVELFTEGDRWFNLKRTGTIDAVMGGPAGACKAKGGTWDSHSQLYPIPVSDIQVNNNIIQNKGY
ncbi:RagB/SusD family nutrient uptake outer membrane protein [Mucilaginibacter ximonensis]|uniref:RagB/SusD family nutrient uptake outer membrane protein n=1 Tax=Mucilaginibacter ximonensis TaxID=538021 RepID=A0ABW5Y9L6_9SPHI